MKAIKKEKGKKKSNPSGTDVISHWLVYVNLGRGKNEGKKREKTEEED